MRNTASAVSVNDWVKKEWLKIFWTWWLQMRKKFYMRHGIKRFIDYLEHSFHLTPRWESWVKQSIYLCTYLFRIHFYVSQTAFFLDTLQIYQLPNIRALKLTSDKEWLCTMSVNWNYFYLWKSKITVKIKIFPIAIQIQSEISKPDKLLSDLSVLKRKFIISR